MLDAISIRIQNQESNTLICGVADASQAKAATGDKNCRHIIVLRAKTD